jgi:hypothetical protein
MITGSNLMYIILTICSCAKVFGLLFERFFMTDFQLVTEFIEAQAPVAVHDAYNRIKTQLAEGQKPPTNTGNPKCCCPTMIEEGSNKVLARYPDYSCPVHYPETLRSDT